MILSIQRRDNPHRVRPAAHQDAKVRGHNICVIPSHSQLHRRSMAGLFAAKPHHNAPSNRLLQGRCFPCTARATCGGCMTGLAFFLPVLRLQGWARLIFSLLLPPQGHMRRLHQCACVCTRARRRARQPRQRLHPAEPRGRPASGSAGRQNRQLRLRPAPGAAVRCG